MRKTQESIVKKATKIGFSQDAINVLSREDVKVEYIQHAFDYISAQRNFKQDDSLISTEVNRIFDFLVEKEQLGYIKNKKSFNDLVNDLLPIDEKDEIIGSVSKFHIYRAYKFYMSVEGNMENERIGVSRAIGFDLYRSYKYFLRAGVNHKTAIHLFQKWKDTFEKKSSPWYRTHMYSYLLDLFTTHFCMLDDLIHNEEAAFAFFIINKGIGNDFCPDVKWLSKLYDMENHHFRFNFEDFNDYFSTNNLFGKSYNVDDVKIASRELHKYPLITYVDNFRTKNHMHFDSWRKDDGIFNSGCINKLFDESKLHAYAECARILDDIFHVAHPSYKLVISISTSMFVSITYKEYNEITVHPNDSHFWFAHEPSVKTNVKMFITPDGKIFNTVKTKNDKERNIPISMSILLHYAERQTLFGDFINYLLQYYIKKNRFVLDVINDFKKAQNMLNLSFNDVIACHNKAHFIETKYKSAAGLNTNWNKKNLSVSYMILKSLSKVDGELSQRILLQQSDAILIPDINFNAKIDEKITEFLTNVICARLVEIESKKNSKRIADVKKQCKEELAEIQTAVLDDEWAPWESERVDSQLNVEYVRRDIRDYVKMCLLTKQKVKLDIKSVRQATNLHDGLAHREHDSYYRTNTKPVNVPKNSRFKNLRTILPQDFEWIQSRKRLILETELQHHCVWSYADKISADNCAIYSFVDSTGKLGNDGRPKRYTIEFGIDDAKNYFIIQVQGKYDRVNTGKMQDFIQEILDKKQSEPKEK